MRKSKLCAVTATLALATATISVSAAPPRGSEAAGPVNEQPPAEVAAVPALAVAGGLGLAGAFVLGFLQGYTDAKNEQTQAAQESRDTGTITTFLQLGGGDIDYVLD